jgi:hypothetical protein
MKSKLRTLTCALATLMLSGCAASSNHHKHSTATHTAAAGRITPIDGAMAVFRAKVSPILCQYVSNLEQAEGELTQTATNAGGAINASAPESAQSEYASAMANFSDVLHSALEGFRSVTPPANLSVNYQQFINSLSSISHEADRVASYAAKRNYTEIAAMENISPATAGNNVFQSAGISHCQPPSS